MSNRQSPSAPPPHKLERIGRYRIVRPLSKGGMALVYEARRESLAGVSPRVAIKLILPDYAGSDTFQELFINEARLGASMHHQNLVQIQDFDREGDSFYIVMEYVEGLTLRRAISLCSRHEIPIPMGVIAESGRQACDGLHFAHMAKDDRGNHLSLVHRDIKPSNLILNPQGVVKILDFGIARGALMQERKGSVKGTWGYMAPEQAMGLDVGPPADVFGLGTVLYEMASQEPLFKKKKPAEIKRLLMDDHAARMAATLDPSYGPLVNVLVRALQRDPAARFTSAQQLGRSLSALLPDPITAREEVTRFYEVVNALNEGLPVPASSRSLHTGTAHTNSPVSIAGSPSTSASGSAIGLILGTTFMGVLALSFVVVLGIVLVYSANQGTGIAELDPVDGDPDALTDGEADPVDEADPGDGTADGADGAEAQVEPAVDDPSIAETRPTPIESRPPPRDTVREPDPPPRDTDAAFESGPTKVTVVRPPPEPEKTKVVIAQPGPGPVADNPPPEEPVADGIGMLTISAVQPAEVYVDGKFVRKVPLVRRSFPSGRHVVTIVANDGRRKSFDIVLKPDEEMRRVWDFDRAEWKK